MAKKVEKGPVKFVRVVFLEGGVPHGYGYSAGEIGTIRDNHLSKLQKLKVVRLATPDDDADTVEEIDDTGEEE
jgi:hypothetical protein